MRRSHRKAEPTVRQFIDHAALELRRGAILDPAAYPPRVVIAAARRIERLNDPQHLADVLIIHLVIAGAAFAAGLFIGAAL